MSLKETISIFVIIFYATAAYSTEAEVKAHAVNSLKNINNMMHLRTKYEVGEPRNNKVRLSHLRDNKHLQFLEYLRKTGLFERKVYETEKVKRERLEFEATLAEEERKRKEARERCKKEGGLCLQGGNFTVKPWNPDAENKGWVLEYLPSKSSVKPVRISKKSETEEYSTFRLGMVTTVRVIKTKQVASTGSCDWWVRVRTWYDYPTIILSALLDYTGFDGYVQNNCYYYGAEGLIWRYNNAVLE